MPQKGQTLHWQHQYRKDGLSTDTYTIATVQNLWLAKVISRGTFAAKHVPIYTKPGTRNPTVKSGNVRLMRPAPWFPLETRLNSRSRRWDTHVPKYRWIYQTGPCNGKCPQTCRISAHVGLHRLVSHVNNNNTPSTDVFYLSPIANPAIVGKLCDRLTPDHILEIV